jgi:hypothetical protein
VPDQQYMSSPAAGVREQRDGETGR